MNNEKKYDGYSVYAHIFPNGKIYIGATRQEPKRRWSGGCGYKWRFANEYSND